MRIAIGTPPFENKNGNPTITQSRQFQWSKSGTVIYPVVLAQAATALRNEGHQVDWMDGIAENITWDQYLTKLIHLRPHYIYWEVKTPIIKQTWNYVRKINQYLPQTKVILCGDHVTALPEESQQNCDCYIKKGGDYDDKKEPVIDRKLTRWELYSSRNGNFKNKPGAYTMFARDCWHRDKGGCTFCSWTNLYRDFSVCSVDHAMDEVESCITSGAKTIFDDSGTFPVEEWMHDFCENLRGLNHDITLGCNMRSGRLKMEDWKNLRSAGFRFVLLGCESGNDATLERLNKGYTHNEVLRACREATKAGLEAHITVMLGYPWESQEDAERTIEFSRHLFRKGWIASMQATLCIPYPGTVLFKEAKEKGWLLTEDWNRYDMTEPILKSPIPSDVLVKMVNDAYKTALTPQNIVRNILKDPKDILRKARYLWNHIKR